MHNAGFQDVELRERGLKNETSKEALNPHLPRVKWGRVVSRTDAQMGI